MSSSATCHFPIRLRSRFLERETRSSGKNQTMRWFAAETYVRMVTVDELLSEDCRHEAEWLSPKEIERLARFQNVQRRGAWLSGRQLSKQLILDVATTDSAAAGSIEICSHDERERGIHPSVRVNGRPQPWSLSISHTDRVVLVGLSTNSKFSIGVDLTLIEPVTSGFIETWFTEKEQSLLSVADPQQVAETWAVKEAVYKACSAGESFVPRRIEVTKRTNKSFGCRYLSTNLKESCEIRTWKEYGHVAAVAVFRTQG